MSSSFWFGYRTAGELIWTDNKTETGSGVLKPFIYRKKEEDVKHVVRADAPLAYVAKQTSKIERKTE